jgi:hypothetical protein
MTFPSHLSIRPLSHPSHHQTPRPKPKGLLDLPPSTQESIYAYALADPDALIALIYTSHTVRSTALRIICREGNEELVGKASEVWAYWRVTKAERWLDEWRGSWE